MARAGVDAMGWRGRGQGILGVRRAAGSAGSMAVWRTMVASPARRVGTLWMGVSSSWCRRATFAFAVAWRPAGATGSRAALVEPSEAWGGGSPPRCMITIAGTMTKCTRNMALRPSVSPMTVPTPGNRASSRSVSVGDSRKGPVDRPEVSQADVRRSEA